MANQTVVSDKKWGYVSVLAATVLFGIWNTFSKILLQDLDPLALSALVYCIAGIFLFAVRFSGFNNRLMGMLDSNSEAETHMSRKGLSCTHNNIASRFSNCPCYIFNRLKSDNSSKCFASIECRSSFHNNHRNSGFKRTISKKGRNRFDPTISGYCFSRN